MLVGRDAMSYIAAGYSWAIGVLAAAPNHDFWSQRVGTFEQARHDCINPINRNRSSAGKFETKRLTSLPKRFAGSRR